MKIFFTLMILSFWADSVSAREDFLICSYKNGTKQIKLPDTKKIQRYEESFPSGVKQLIVINDPWTLNSFDNYTMLSKGEHTITYSLDCKKDQSKDNK